MVSEHLRVREFILSALLKATILHSKDATAAAQTEEKEKWKLTFWTAPVQPTITAIGQVVNALFIQNFFSAKQG